jgi:hypothetical protein
LCERRAEGRVSGWTKANKYLAGDERLGVEQLAVGTSADLVDDGGLRKEGARRMK